jgi:hypothetical protein
VGAGWHSCKHSGYLNGENAKPSHKFKLRKAVHWPFTSNLIIRKWLRRVKCMSYYYSLFTKTFVEVADAHVRSTMDAGEWRYGDVRKHIRDCWM